MSLDNPLDRSQADTRAGKLMLRLESFESDKKLFGIGRIKTDSVIFHPKGAAIHADFYSGLLLPRTELDRVTKQVVENDPQQFGICVSEHTWLNMNFESVSVGSIQSIVDCASRKLRDIDRLTEDFSSSNP
jgi:hypothetical protein